MGLIQASQISGAIARIDSQPLSTREGAQIFAKESDETTDTWKRRQWEHRLTDWLNVKNKLKKKKELFTCAHIWIPLYLEHAPVSEIYLPA